MKLLLTSTLALVFCTFSIGAVAEQKWPESIPIPAGFEAEAIERGKGAEFFVGANSLSSLFGEAFFGVPKELSATAGAIYKGNLRTGEGAILAPPTGKPVSGLSYDRRTDYLYAATGFGDLVNGSFTDQGVIVYDASSGDVIMEIGFGDNIVINDVLVTRNAVYFTDSFNPYLWKLPLGKGGRLPSNPVFEMISMPGFEMVNGFNANGLVGKFKGNKLVIVNTSTGVLYQVDTASGDASPIEIEGAEQLFVNGDGMYLDGRTLYIIQNFDNKIAVIQLSKDLSSGQFIENIPGEGEVNPLDVATSIIGFRNSIYAINTNFFDLIFGNTAEVQADVVRLRKSDSPASIISNSYQLDFGTQNRGSKSRLDAIIENVASSRRIITAVEITGADASMFKTPYSKKLPRFIYPGQSPWVNVYYKPTSNRSHSALLTLYVDDDTTVEIQLSGKGRRSK